MPSRIRAKALLMSPSGIVCVTDEMRHAEALAPALFLRIHIDADDHCGADEAKPLDNVQADAAETKHNALGARFDFCTPMPVVTPQPM